MAEVKKFALINNYENIIAYSEESQRSEMYANKCGLFQIHFGDLRLVQSQENVTIFILI